MKRKMEKLVLSKETLREMTQAQLPGVNGGRSGSACRSEACTFSCPTDETC